MKMKTQTHVLHCHSGVRQNPRLVGCNSREANCTGWDCAGKLGSPVGYGIAPNPPYKTGKVIQ